MAYGNWGAVVAENGKLRMDLCDYSDENVGGHAVVLLDGYVLEFYKHFFPTIYEKKDSVYVKLSDQDLFELLEYKNDVMIARRGNEKEEFFYFDKPETYFEFSDFSIYSCKFFDIKVYLIKQGNNIWNVLIGCGYGNGFKGLTTRLMKKAAKRQLYWGFPFPLRLILCQYIDRFFSNMGEIKWKLRRMYQRFKTIFSKRD